MVLKGLCPSVELYFGLILSCGVMELLPDDMSSDHTFHSLQWEAVVCPPVISLLVGLLFILRFVQSMRRQLYIRREKQLADTLAALIEEKCQLLEKISAAHKVYKEAESSLEEARLEKEALRVPSLVDNYRKAKRMKAMLNGEFTLLVHELKKERSKHVQQEEAMEKMLETLEILDEVMETSTAQGLQSCQVLSPTMTPSEHH